MYAVDSPVVFGSFPRKSGEDNPARAIPRVSGHIGFGESEEREERDGDERDWSGSDHQRAEYRPVERSSWVRMACLVPWLNMFFIYPRRFFSSAN